MFVEKMSQLYKTEKRLQKQRKQAFARMETAPVQSMTPVKTVFMEYSKMANKGWNCGVLAQSLKLIIPCLPGGDLRYIEIRGCAIL